MIVRLKQMTSRVLLDILSLNKGKVLLLGDVVPMLEEKRAFHVHLRSLHGSFSARSSPLVSFLRKLLDGTAAFKLR